MGSYIWFIRYSFRTDKIHINRSFPYEQHADQWKLQGSVQMRLNCVVLSDFLSADASLCGCTCVVLVVMPSVLEQLFRHLCGCSLYWRLLLWSLYTVDPLFHLPHLPLRRLPPTPHTHTPPGTCTSRTTVERSVWPRLTTQTACRTCWWARPNTASTSGTSRGPRPSCCARSGPSWPSSTTK